MEMRLQVEVPERTLKQRLDALEEANRIRTFRAQLKRDVKAGRKDAVLLLLEPPERIETMKVSDLLLAMPKVGRTKVQKILARSRISPSKTVGGMTERQRGELVLALGYYSRGS